MEELLKVDEVASRLRISLRMVWKLVETGKLPKPVKLATASRWKKTDIENFIAGLCDNAEASLEKKGAKDGRIA